jgi:uncharacterized protein (TIGR03437 family)
MRHLSIRQPIRHLALVCLATAGWSAWAQPPQLTIHFRAGGEEPAWVEVPTGTTFDAQGFHLSPDGELSASLTKPPGTYTLQLTDRIKAAVTLDPLQTVPPGSTRPPVILLNGWQLFGLGCLSGGGVTGTFGAALEADLKKDGVPVVYHFDNCVEGRGAKIEDLGATLGQVIGLIRYSDGRPIDSVDLIAHSMGGLIIRAYLAGLQADGTLAPPSNHKVRKVVQVATPNFGSFLAVPNIDDQSTEMIPGSQFLWNLATWNQRNDDLRGVDAIVIAGNAGHKPLLGGSSYPPANGSDGVVSLTSASLSFAYDPSRTRVLPYCHSDFDLSVQVVVDCQGSGIAKAPETESIIRAFLAGNDSWNGIGTPASKDPILTKSGGVMFEAFDASNRPYTDLTTVSFGTTALKANGAIFTQDLLEGMAPFLAASKSLGIFNCGSVTPATGSYSPFRCKPAPVIQGIAPAVAGTYARMVPSGGSITITGAGFGPSQCRTCQLSAGQTPLAILAWSDQSIIAVLPAAFDGFVTLTLQTAAGLDAVNIIAAAPAVPPTLTVSPGALEFIYTVGQALPPAQSIAVDNGGSGGPLAWSAQASDSWIVLSGSGPASATLSVAVNPSGLAAGIHTGTIVISAPGAASSPASIAVKINVSQPASSLTIVNAASGAAGPVAPGEIVVISGTNLSKQVFFGGNAAVILFYSPAQIVSVVPQQVAGQSSTLVQVGESSLALPVAVTNPALFSLSGQAIAANQDGFLNGFNHPARAGSTITVYVTGGGLTSATGAYTAGVSASIGGIPTTVPTAGAVPGNVAGVGQVKLQVPILLDPGVAPVAIQIGGVPTPGPVTVWIQ